jgi:hypothetical protein
MDLLDERVVLLVFIDNANLSGSAAKSFGALLRPAIRDRPEAAKLRHELEQFLDVQRDGYARLYDAKAGQFYFGWDATKDRLFGWTNLEGNWTTGHVDYLVNEFRGPATFIVARFGFPLDAIKNLSFKMKPYALRDGREIYVLAPWEGSAFQALGLELSFSEWDRPGWRELLRNVVDVEIDYCMRNKLPGFLSESYTGEGVELPAASAFRTSQSRLDHGTRARPRSTRWARRIRSHPITWNGSWRRTGRSCRPF